MQDKEATAATLVPFFRRSRWRGWFVPCNELADRPFTRITMLDSHQCFFDRSEHMAVLTSDLIPGIFDRDVAFVESDIVDRVLAWED